MHKIRRQLSLHISALSLMLKHFSFKAPGLDFRNHLDSHSATFYCFLSAPSLSPPISVRDYIISAGPNTGTLVTVLRSLKAPWTHIATRWLHLSAVSKQAYHCSLQCPCLSTCTFVSFVLIFLQHCFCDLIDSTSALVMWLLLWSYEVFQSTVFFCFAYLYLLLLHYFIYHSPLDCLWPKCQWLKVLVVS